MATICRITRNHYIPPQFRSVADWFSYTFATSEIDGMLSCLSSAFSTNCIDCMHIFSSLELHYRTC